MLGRIGVRSHPFRLRRVDVEITPEPSEAERQAILRALELERDEAREPAPWRREALGPVEDQAGAPPRQSRGATRA
jgi:hypothetical protein